MPEQRALRWWQWATAWHALGIATPDEALFDRLLAAYAEPQRHYHSMQHLGECLDWLDRTRDAVLLVDIDLSILGATPARFAEYEAQIRREYAHVPPDPFAPRRRELLQRFLVRDPLFQTEALRSACEAQARRNLRSAINAVG